MYWSNSVLLWFNVWSQLFSKLISALLVLEMPIKTRQWVYEKRKVNFDTVTADVCVLRCFLMTKPEANYLRFHARVDTARPTLRDQLTSRRTQHPQKNHVFKVWSRQYKVSVTKLVCVDRVSRFRQSTTAGEKKSVCAIFSQDYPILNNLHWTSDAVTSNLPGIPVTCTRSSTACLIPPQKRFILSYKDQSLFPKHFAIQHLQFSCHFYTTLYIHMQLAQRR
jgi:hypothetical protein